MKFSKLVILAIFLALLPTNIIPTQAAPGAAQLQSPPDGTQLPDFDATLTWSNPPGTTQYYLEVIPYPSAPGGPPDGPGITLVRNAETSFTLQPPQMGQGNYVLLPDITYTWRISAGDSSSFAPPGDPSYGPAAQRTFRTPAVSSSGITPLQPGNGGSVDNVTPLLQWANSPPEADQVFYYEIQLSKDSGFNTDARSAIAPVYWELVHGGVTNPLNSYQVREEFPLDSESRYFWRVRPRVQGDGQPVAWSQTFSFTTPEARIGLQRAFPNLIFPQLTNMVQPNDGTGRFFATEQRGVVRVFGADGSATVFLDIQGQVLTSNNEEGLLGLAFDPDFRNNGHFYLYYSADSPRQNVVSRFSVRADDPNRADESSEAVLLDLPKPFGNHNGGQLAFGPDGYLYLGPGDGGSGGDPFRNGQNLGVLLGKILRIDVRGVPAEGYRIPPDNPFVGVPGARGEVWAYGLRNPWRFSFDRATGRMWVGDVGQNAWEEIDLVEKGRNYGWNVMEGAHCYSPSSGCNRDGLELPVTEYSHDDGCSVTGGYVYRGNGLPSLQGAYIYGDYCSGNIWALWHDGSRIVQEKFLLDSGLQITSFAEDLAGEIYVLSRSSGIYRLVQE